MTRETELNLFVPSPELLVRLASGDRPLGIRAGPPRIKALRETFFDTPDQALRRRGMTCKLRQVEGEEPSVVVTVGENPDSEGITSRSRLTAAAIGAGVFETLRGDTEPATQIQKFVDPGQLRPQIALDIQRLGRVFRGGLFLKPVLLLFFDRITVQVGGTSSVFHEISIRRRREGGPMIRDIGRRLRDEFHLFPDGLTTLQRAHRVLAVEKKAIDKEFSPYGLNLALAIFRDGKLGLTGKGDELLVPTFKGSGEDAARALAADMTGEADLPLLRLGTTELREGRSAAELWTIPDPVFAPEVLSSRAQLTWFPWHELMEEVGRPDLRDPTLVSTLLLLSRRKLLGQLPWVPGRTGTQGCENAEAFSSLRTDWSSGLPPELRRIEDLLPLLREIEDTRKDLKARLEATSQLSAELDRVFFQDVTRAKGRILSGGSGGEEDEGEDEGEDAPIQLVDIMSIRVRGIVDRVDRCLEEDLLGRLEEAGIHLRSWSGLMRADRLAILEDFSSQHLPSMQVAPEWGPSFVPEMPLAGCAIGILARIPGVDGIRFFHVVLRKEPPSFLPVPGSTTVLPIEEVIRGYFLTQMPELERAETFMFRFMTGAATVREPTPIPDPPQGDSGGIADGTVAPEGSNQTPPPPLFSETHQSVVVRVLANRKMPESYQAQLLRALERQVSRRNPLIGWSDLYTVAGPLDWAGLDQLLDLPETPRKEGR
ncbi:MAG: hypothetical protein ABIF09_07255 [Gemmatimonadota bacterium]